MGTGCCNDPKLGAGEKCANCTKDFKPTTIGYLSISSVEDVFDSSVDAFDEDLASIFSMCESIVESKAAQKAHAITHTKLETKKNLLQKYITGPIGRTWNKGKQWVVRKCEKKLADKMGISVLGVRDGEIAIGLIKDIIHDLPATIIGASNVG